MNKNRLSNFATKIAQGLEEGIQFAAGAAQLKMTTHSLIEPIHEIDFHEFTRIREQLGLSRSRLAAILNVSGTTLKDWETGKHKPSRPAIRLLQLLQSHPALFSKGIQSSRFLTDKLSVLDERN